MTDLQQSENKSNLTEEDFSLISQAQDEFNEKRYDCCYKTLCNLEKSTGSSSRIKHNKSIVEFYKNGCKDYLKLLKALDEDSNEVMNKSDILQRPVTKLFNKSVIYYHLKKFYTAIEILSPVIEKIEDLDENTSSNVGILYLSLLIATNQIKKAQKFLGILQIHLGINLDTLAEDENSSPESLSSIDGFSRMFKLITLLTNVLNKNFVVVPDDGTIEYAGLKAHQYYLGKDFQMAAKQLSKNFVLDSFSVESHGENQNTCIANNMGIIHLRVRHYALAATFFQRAMVFDKEITNKLDNAPLHFLSAPRTPEILYNLGIAMLHLKRPKEAFDCFLVPLKVYHQNPRLWFRIAETCIMMHEMSMKGLEKKHVVAEIIGNRYKYILEPTPRLRCSDGGASSAIPNPTLEFGSLCLRNALSLVDSYRNHFPNESSETQTENIHEITDDDNNICNPSMPITKESFDKLISAIYSAYSYVSLKLGNYVVALEHARDLLKLKNISNAYKMLGRLYSAEALIMLDKIGEARTFLKPNLISELDKYDFETEIWSINSIDAAQSVIKYNAVVALILHGKLDLAITLLSTCNHPIIAHKAKMLKKYLNIIGAN